MLKEASGLRDKRKQFSPAFMGKLTKYFKLQIKIVGALILNKKGQWSEAIKIYSEQISIVE